MKRRALLQALSSFPLSLPVATAVTSPNTAAPVIVESPDGGIRVEFGLCDKPGKQSVACYSVSFREKKIIQQASLSLQLAPDGPFDSDLRILGITHQQEDATYKIYPGKTSVARDRYRQAVVSLEEAKAPRRRLELVFRVYDDGVAFRYRFPEQPALRELIITAENSTLSFVGNPLAYTLPLPSFTTPYETYYRPIPLNEVSPDPLLALPSTA